ncbi:MAG: PEP-CTERM sorting domain-containing protein [Colwellia sp.]|nr:PEP-CTERM sorting domain-containing protein [Colwellia sp.]
MTCIKWIVAVAFSALSFSSFATDVSGETIMDNYIGAGNSSDIHGDSFKFDVDKMVVSRDGTILNVDIFTAFYNDIGSIKLGDLFMATGNGLESPWDPNGDQPNENDRYSNSGSNTGTDWNYVYDLGGGRGSKSGTGELKSGFTTADLITSSELHSDIGVRDNQAVRIADKNSQTIHSSSAWNVDDNYSYAKTVGGSYNGYGKVSFSFDVTGTALATANQIAFRWAMTCANDIIEGVASFTPADNSTVVPEPQTIILMLLAMAGLIYRRKSTQL